MKTKTICILFFFSVSMLSYAQENTQSYDSFWAKNPDKIFLGAILDGSSLNKDNYNFFNVPLNPIVISFSLPVKSKEIDPSYDNMMEAIRQSLKEQNVLKSNYAFSYSVQELKSYKALNLYFGQEINPSTLFGIQTDKKAKKTLLVMNIKQSFFSVEMDISNNICADPNFLTQHEKEALIYVISIEFGRRAMLVAESNFEYQDLKEAITNLLKAAENNSQVDEKSKSIIMNSTVRVLLAGDDNDIKSADLNNPLADLSRYLNKEVTPENFGIPIEFSAAYLHNNGLFHNVFNW